MSLTLVPIKQAAAKQFVRLWHRHNRPPAGDIFRVAVENDEGEIVAVGMAGRPSARAWDDGTTVEITRCATDGTFNANSMLYGALSRAAFALGYRRVITYTQADESGASLRAAGWRVIGQRPPRKGWDAPSRPRDNTTYLSTPRTVWEAS